MKNLNFKKIKATLIVLIVLLGINAVFAQNPKEIKNMKVFSSSELKAKFDVFKKDAGFSALFKDATSKGFGKIEDQKSSAYSWGFSGKVEVGHTSEDVVICGYDFANKEGQLCTMIWGKRGTKTYKAYMIYPKGKDGLDALGEAQEWYADDNNKIQLAHSLKTCLRNWINDECTGWCKDSNKNCLSAATKTKTVTITIGFIKYTTTVSSFSLGNFVGCVAASCMSCIALGITSCLLSV